MNAIEAASLAAWPALEELDFPGWCLRFSRGYSKRANSANCLVERADLEDEQIGRIETLYRARGLPPVFRLSSCASPDKLDRVLASRGYRFKDLSLVMTAPLGPAPPIDGAATLSLASGPEAWLAEFGAVAGKAGPEQDVHLDLLKAIRHPHALALGRLGPDGGTGMQTACCGLGVKVGVYLGLFDIATATACQGRGHATRLCRGLMNWGCEAGARLAFLQVVAVNLQAIRLYERLGFRRAYQYWYRVLD